MLRAVLLGTTLVETAQADPGFRPGKSSPKIAHGMYSDVLRYETELAFVLTAGMLILADNLTITLFSIEIGGWGILEVCYLYFGTIACTKLGLSAFSEQGMPLSKKRRITGPGVRCIGVIILILNGALIVGYLYVLFERFMEMKGGV